MFGSVPDLLRLLAVPVFGWAAYRDVRTRRVPNWTWYPLVVLGVVLLAWEVVVQYPPADYQSRLFFVRTALSLGFVVPLAYLFWRIGGFGGADAKALMTLALLVPTYPVYYLPWGAFPMQRTTLGVFSMTVLTNTVLVGVAYPLVLAARNVAAGEVSPVMVVGRRVRVADLPSVHGRLFEDTSGFTRSGLDVDALRMYLRWRGVSLADLRENPAYFRDPATVEATYDPTDGAVMADGGSESAPATPSERPVGDGDEHVNGDVNGDGDPADPWAAERFLDEIEGSAYGTTPHQLREGLALVTEREWVWVSPGIPFLVPMFVGLCLALTYGDVFFGLLSALGVV